MNSLINKIFRRIFTNYIEVYQRFKVGDKAVEKMKEGVKMRMIKVSIGLLVMLYVFSSSCWAMEQDFVVRRLAVYSQFKMSAASIAFEVKDRFAKETNEYKTRIAALEAEKKSFTTDSETYSNANQTIDKLNKDFSERAKKYAYIRSLYQDAAAKFGGWRAAVGLFIINKAQIPDDEIYLGNQGLAYAACRSYGVFWKNAHAFLNDRELPQNTLSQSELASVTEKSLFGAGLTFELVSDVITSLVYPGIEKMVDVRKQIEAEKKEKRDKLLSWLDQYYAWDNWTSIGAEIKSDNTSTSSATK